MRLPPPPPGERELLGAAPAYLVLLLAFLLHVSLGTFFQRSNLPFGIAYGQILFFFGIPWLAARALGQSPRRFFALATPEALAWPWVVLAAVASFVLAGGLNALNQWAVGEELTRLFDSTQVLRNRPRGEQLAIALGVTFLAPFGEEFLFRGYLLRVLRARYGTWAGLLVSSALFALMHLNPASLVALFGLGLVFGLLRIVSGSLLPALVAHAVQNGVTAYVVLASDLPPGEPEILPGMALLFALGALPLLGLAVGMIRRIVLPEESEPRLDSGPAGFDLRRVRRGLVIWLASAVLSAALFLLVG